MRKLKVEQFGTKVQGVTLRGDPRDPEPITFLVKLPGGDVEIARTPDGEYWVHVRVNDADQVRGTEDAPHPLRAGRICDGRMDVRDRHAGEVDGGAIDDPGLYHLAVRVATREQA